MRLFYQHNKETLSMIVSATSQMMNDIYKMFTVDVLDNSFSHFATKHNLATKIRGIYICNFLELKFSQDRAVQGHDLTVQ